MFCEAVRCTVMPRTALLALLLSLALAHGQKTAPQPRVVDPGDGTHPPSDATVVFNGKNMEGWTTTDGNPARCVVAEGAMACTSGVGDIVTQEKFGSAQIHLEFNVPSMPAQKGQLRGNSGCFCGSSAILVQGLRGTGCGRRNENRTGRMRARR